MHNLPRRDLVFTAGKRAEKLTRKQAAVAWYYLSGYLQALGDRDMPRFDHLFESIRLATIHAKTDKSPSRRFLQHFPTPPPKPPQPSQASQAPQQPMPEIT